MTKQLPDAPAEALPARFGQYVIVREIGKGGMATVYEATHEMLGKRVALKVMHVDARVKPSAAARFLREARAAAQIRHGHIVNVFDVGTESGTPFIVMDLVDGPDLADWLKKAGTLSARKIAELFLPIASAVWSAHQAGIVHRDLKPSNVLVGQFPRGIVHPTVVDFGISKILDEVDVEPLTRSEALIGTPHYMSPEQIRGPKFVTERTDQYALGVMLYQCATGRLPFEGKNTYELMHAITTAPVAKPRQLDAGISREFEAVILRAMHRDPSRRFPSVQALASALLTFAGPECWARWGLELASGTLGDAGSAVPHGPGSTAADDRLDARGAAWRRGSSIGRKRFGTRTVATTLVVAAMAAAVLVAMKSARSVPSDQVAAIPATRATAAATAIAAAETSDPAPAALATKTQDDLARPRSELAEAPVRIAEPPRAKPSGTRRAPSTRSAAAVADEPGPPPAPIPSRERGQNGAFILE